MIVSDLLLLCIESYTLTDDRWFWACSAPDGKGHFEADSKDTLTCFAGSVTKSMPVGSKLSSRVGIGETYLPASLLAEVVPSCSGGT